MILTEIVLMENIIKTPEGTLEYGWKNDLEEEEEEGYIPPGYKKRVLELQMIKVKTPGQGHGDTLMKAFMETPQFKRAELVFLDPSPGIGANRQTDMSEAKQVARLVKFYKRYGFRHNPKSATKRMWLVRKGELSDTELPT